MALLGAIVIMLLAGAGLYAWTWRPAIAPIRLETLPALSPAAVDRGARLAVAERCASCHTRPEGPAYAGGSAVATPFGLVTAPNITPDPRTGIGSWSPDAFRRAMREGVRRDGERLYPVPAHLSYARLSEQDLDALYAFLMTRGAVRNVTGPDRLPFPRSQRWLVAVWRLGERAR
jgi:nicotinate dehydrogenase subunit B